MGGIVAVGLLISALKGPTFVAASMWGVHRVGNRFEAFSRG